MIAALIHGHVILAHYWAGWRYRPTSAHAGAWTWWQGIRYQVTSGGAR